MVKGSQPNLKSESHEENMAIYLTTGKAKPLVEGATH
jgi:hypothetical protein